MLHHYAERFQWIFRYTSKNFGYCLLKTLCIIVGLPIYLVCFVVEMVLTLVNLIFSVVPGLGLVVMLVCKVLMWIVDKPYYICVLTDLKKFYISTHDVPEYDVPEYEDVTHLSNGKTEGPTADQTTQPTDQSNDQTDEQQ